MQSIRSIRRLPPHLVHRTLLRPLSSSGGNISGGAMGKAWADKEHAAENQYFNKKDAEVLAQLAQKLRNQTAPTAESLALERESVLAIFQKHGTTPSDALLEDLVKFKFNHH
eukprot:GFKZ01010138.1.p1 GENE.GFKZ01010138.1~~GFKZ01010138.1.p1  ORF type:complete len:112 (+),score=18.97 GFKZ01010138.1:168-503(+)